MTMNSADSDAALIARFLGGDESSFRELHARHAPRLRAVVVRLLGPQGGEADDACQDAWLAACQSLASFRGDALFSTWLTTIGLRVARRRIQKTLLFVELDEQSCAKDEM